MDRSAYTSRTMRRIAPSHADESRRELAAAIAQDLRALVLVLSSLFEREVDDGEALIHILNAKFAAERGLFLSERMVDLIAESGRQYKTQ